MADEPLIFNRKHWEFLRRIGRKVDGLSGVGVVNKPDSITIIPPPAKSTAISRGSDPGMFPVLITPNGGADGNGVTIATWLYNVTRLNGTVVGTAMAQVRQRPYGKAIQAIPDLDGNIYGVAFYDANGDVKLWDANEVEDRFVCEV